MTMDAGVSAVEDADFAKGRVGEKGMKEELTLPTPTIRVELPLLFTPHKSPTVID